MERKRFSVLFFIKRSKLLKNGEAPVRVRVTYDRPIRGTSTKAECKSPTLVAGKREVDRQRPKLRRT